MNLIDNLFGSFLCYRKLSKKNWVFVFYTENIFGFSEIKTKETKKWFLNKEFERLKSENFFITFKVIKEEFY